MVLTSCLFYRDSAPASIIFQLRAPNSYYAVSMSDILFRAFDYTAGTDFYDLSCPLGYPSDHNGRSVGSLAHDFLLVV